MNNLFYFFNNKDMFLSRCIMYILGYKVDRSVYEAFKTQKVVIFPHTSRFEAFIGCMGFWLSGNRENICFPVAKNYMETPILGSCLAYFGAVKKVDKTGMVGIITKYMKENPNRVLMISPEGSLSPKEWKSGFFYIAQNLSIPIVVGGVDFVNHRLICNLDQSYKPEKEDKYEDKLPELQLMFAKSGIYPLRPEKSNPTVIMEQHMKPRIIPIQRIIVISTMAITVIAIIINYSYCHC